MELEAIAVVCSVGALTTLTSMLAKSAITTFVLMTPTTSFEVMTLMISLKPIFEGVVGQLAQMEGGEKIATMNNEYWCPWREAMDD
ncbi:hypothetical protein VNO78_23358 [Psophocarpus tetragonolobus]|uniref:Uncharacterized protein n=1 Tax=Psophocarpus tetragonolobus TaxID=3891 RepID=A0AAN9S6H8_PSOTE